MAVKVISSRVDLDQLFDPDRDVKSLLFKHSLICGASSAALEEMYDFSHRHPSAPIYLLEIQPHREISDEVARRSGIRHQSPQALVFRSGRVHWHASHYRITSKTLSEAMA